MNYNRYYAKISFIPWNSLSLLNSGYPEPHGIIKTRILSKLIAIYLNWKEQPDAEMVSCYLTIWLFEPRFSMSQIVAAKGDLIYFYDGGFYKPGNGRKIILSHYGELKKSSPF